MFPNYLLAATTDGSGDTLVVAAWNGRTLRIVSRHADVADAVDARERIRTRQREVGVRVLPV